MDTLNEQGNSHCIELQSGTVMAELFEAIGFRVSDVDSYNLLAEYTEDNGLRSRIDHGDSALQGRCWKVGEGLEVWSILHERGDDVEAVDCRPSFRARHIGVVQPWELIEYDEDGEAIVKGVAESGVEVVFELQNLTEVNPRIFREPRLSVGLAGLVYSSSVRLIKLAKAGPQLIPYRFEPADGTSGSPEEGCENDYFVSGRVLAWREIENPITSSRLLWVYVDAGVIQLELMMNRAAIRGQLRIGALISADIWLQGHVLDAAEMLARYEGVDRDYDTGSFWAGLRREN
jgi:hypothetical protein